jgi:hypothetical protein
MGSYSMSPAQICRRIVCYHNSGIQFEDAIKGTPIIGFSHDLHEVVLEAPSGGIDDTQIVQSFNLSVVCLQLSRRNQGLKN